MTSKIPAGLKAADITRFATRAVQLEKFKPVISYWCTFPADPLQPTKLIPA